MDAYTYFINGVNDGKLTDLQNKIDDAINDMLEQQKQMKKVMDTITYNQ